MSFAAAALKDSGVFFFRTFFSTHFSRLRRKLKVAERKCAEKKNCVLERGRERESILLSSTCVCSYIKTWPRDTQHNGVQHNDTQYNRTT